MGPSVGCCLGPMMLGWAQRRGRSPTSCVQNTVLLCDTFSLRWDKHTNTHTHTKAIIVAEKLVVYFVLVRRKICVNTHHTEVWETLHCRSQQRPPNFPLLPNLAFLQREEMSQENGEWKHSFMALKKSPDSKHYVIGLWLCKTCRHNTRMWVAATALLHGCVWNVIVLLFSF